MDFCSDIDKLSENKKKRKKGFLEYKMSKMHTKLLLYREKKKYAKIELKHNILYCKIKKTTKYRSCNMDRNKKELFWLMSFLIEVKTQHKRLNKKKIDLFNFDKEIYKIESVKYCRSNRVKSSAKALDNNRIVVKMRLSRYGYYKIFVKAKEINQNDIVFLNDALKYFFE